jgi:hypothetical protein
MRKFLVALAAIIVVFVTAAARNLGAEPIAGLYIMDFWSPDEPHGIRYKELASPLPGQIWAQCRHGTLFVEEQREEPFVSYTLAPGKVYHGLDSPLFHMDIRENAKARVQAYLESKRQSRKRGS